MEYYGWSETELSLLKVGLEIWLSTANGAQVNGKLNSLCTRNRPNEHYPSNALWVETD